MADEDTIDPQRNLRRMYEYAPLYAQAKADRIHIEGYLKSKKALLMKSCGEASIGAQEREALAHPEYLALLDGLKAAVEQEELLRYRYETARVAIDVYRTQQASNRNMDRSAA
jgi:hypothetical protein